MRFKPDEQIFGKGCAFKPGRLLKMARSKAYLFGGVEIRWTCAPELIKDDTPEKAVFHFPGGLKDFMATRTEGLTLVTKDAFAGRIEQGGRARLGRMGGRLDRRRGRLRQLLLQHRADARWRHARGGLARRR